MDCELSLLGPADGEERARGMELISRSKASGRVLLGRWVIGGRRLLGFCFSAFSSQAARAAGSTGQEEDDGRSFLLSFMSINYYYCCRLMVGRELLIVIRFDNKSLALSC